jgi:multicomponent Na+:H+ antiporter subunit C
MSVFPYLVAAWLFLVGLYGIVTSRNVIHLVVCISIVQSSTYVLLLAIGYRTGGTAPVLDPSTSGRRLVDPVVAALTLTDVVVSATVTALLLTICMQIYKRAHTLDPDEINSLQG